MEIDGIGREQRIAFTVSRAERKSRLEKSTTSWQVKSNVRGKTKWLLGGASSACRPPVSFQNTFAIARTIGRKCSLFYE